MRTYSQRTIKDVNIALYINLTAPSPPQRGTQAGEKRGWKLRARSVRRGQLWCQALLALCTGKGGILSGEPKWLGGLKVQIQSEVLFCALKTQTRTMYTSRNNLSCNPEDPPSTLEKSIFSFHINTGPSGFFYIIFLLLVQIIEEPKDPMPLLIFLKLCKIIYKIKVPLKNQTNKNGKRKCSSLFYTM